MHADGIQHHTSAFFDGHGGASNRGRKSNLHDGDAESLLDYLSKRGDRFVPQSQSSPGGARQFVAYSPRGLLSASIVSRLVETRPATWGHAVVVGAAPSAGTSI